jgi:hypothetical protein
LLKVLYLPMDEAGDVLGQAGGGRGGEQEKEERPTKWGRTWPVGFHPHRVLANQTDCWQSFVRGMIPSGGKMTPEAMASAAVNDGDYNNATTSAGASCSRSRYDARDSALIQAVRFN